jgi:phosphate transport system substrate-binding protein
MNEPMYYWQFHVSFRKGVRSMGKKISVYAGFMLAIVILASFIAGPVKGQDKKVVRISGAGLLSEVVENFREDFDKANPLCQLTVSGATTGIGFKKLIDAEAEVAMMTRKVTSEEAKLAEAKGVTLASKLIGKIGLAVVTNSQNKVNELTIDQLAKIFKGEIPNWSQVGGSNEPIKVTIRAVPETGAGVLFQEIVLKGAPYAKDAQIMSSYGTTLQVCGKSFAIGYIPTTTIHFDKLSARGAKIIRIKKDANSEPYQLSSGLARESLYPISLEFILVWNSKLENPCTKGFAEFCEKQAQ